MTPQQLTICEAQERQPWTVPYSTGVMIARDNGMPHIMGSHAALHAAKSVGKLAAVFEALDHSGFTPNEEQLQTIRAMSADLVTVALRLANLYGFDLAAVLVQRVEEKNGVSILS